MEPKHDPMAERLVGQVGAMAEVVSVFYNSLIRQVPKEVALELTKHMMNLSFPGGQVNGAMNRKALSEVKQLLERHKKQWEAAQAEQEPDLPPKTRQEPEASEQTEHNDMPES